MSVKGEWGVTAQQEAEETRRVQEFQETVPKMRSQLRVLTHLYQVAELPSSLLWVHSDAPLTSHTHTHIRNYQKNIISITYF